MNIGATIVADFVIAVFVILPANRIRRSSRERSAHLTLSEQPPRKLEVGRDLAVR